jgi:hypothetical protein
VCIISTAQQCGRLTVAVPVVLPSFPLINRWPIPLVSQWHLDAHRLLWASTCWLGTIPLMQQRFAATHILDQPGGECRPQMLSCCLALPAGFGKKGGEAAKEKGAGIVSGPASGCCSGECCLAAKSS